MPFFAPKGNTGYYTPNVSKNPSPAVTAGTGVGKDEDKDAAKDGAKDGAKDESGSEDQTINVKKKLKKKEDDDEDTETSKNTKLNALLYHTSDDTVDLYKRENNSSDLLGRLYYDDYDSDSAASDGNASPMIGLSPVSSGHNLVADYFAAARFPGSTASINGILSDPTVPHTPTNGAATGQVSTPGGSHTPSFMIGARSPSAGPRVRPAVQRLASFERGISFDNSEDDHRRSLTFKVRHPNFKFRRNNKTFLAGYDGEMESLKSIEWLFDEMIVNGDTIIILQVLDEKLYHTIDKSKAKESLRRLELLNKHVKKVSMVFEIVIGKPQKLLQAAIDEYNPQMMAIGTHNYEDREGNCTSTTRTRRSYQSHQHRSTS